MKNQFGYCVRGHHPSLQITYNSVNHIQCNEGKQWKEVCILNCQLVNDSLQRFIDTESLGTQNLLPKCGGCKCGKCLLGHKNCTIKEERELHLIDEGLTLNEDEHTWTVKYSWVKSPNLLPNNYLYVLARLKSLERKLVRKGGVYSGKYNNEIQDMLNRNVARKLTEKEVKEYSGIVYYQPHHEVLKLQSVSTPMRIVFDASASYMGQCINDFWPKGPNVLTDILAVILRFRQFNVAFVADIKKMYNSIKLSLKDQHTHRFLWRWMDPQIQPNHYVLLTVPFGDRPSGVIASLALQRTAKIMCEKYPHGAKIIEHNSYVDDLLSSAETIEGVKSAINEVEAVLKYGGFSVKHWVVSGEFDESLSELTDLKFIDSKNEKVLGMTWSPKKDTFGYRFNLEFTIHNGSQEVEHSQNIHRISNVVPEIVTPRMMLSQLAKIYDPLGLISPFVLGGKVLMRKTLEFEIPSSITNKGQRWDVSLSGELREGWVKFFDTLHELEKVEFERCLKPIGAVGKPELIIFTDASEIAYGSCAYARWKIKENTYESRLIMAKNRLAPKRKLTIPRLELSAAVIGSRLRKQILNEMDYIFERVICLTDSMIVRYQIQKESYGFKTFTATRVGEIQGNGEPSEWLWIPTNLNPADLITRVSEVNEPLLTLWKEGPEFLKIPFDKWPARADCDVEPHDIPDRYMINLAGCDKEEEIEKVNIFNLNVIKLERFNSYKRLVAVTAIILAIVRIASFKVGKILDDGQCFRVAEEEWIRFIQKDLGKNWLIRFRRLGPWINKSKIIVVGERFTEWFKMPWNQSELILLPARSRFTYLYILMIHREDHTIDATAAKVRRRFWVPQLMKIVRRIKGECVTCRKLDKKAVVQRMGSLPIDRLTPSPPFYITFIDLFGPIQIRDTVKGRCRGKSYGVIFNCGTCRAVYLDVGEGYDTDSFLLVLRRFITIHGYPSKFISDHGTQIVAGSREMAEIMKKWEWSRITQFGKYNGVSWEFNKSADAPWQNGCSESLIRLTKRNIASSIGSNILTINELQTILFEIANLLNERPIGMRASDPTESYICPNDLLMGRASKNAPIGDFDINPKLLKRLAVCQDIVQCFWKVWQQRYFHTLIIRQQWHTEVRNLKEGDLVIVRHTNQIRGKWQMAIVVEAVPGKDGRVRDVTIKYKNNNSGNAYDGGVDVIVKRSVHNLVLILPMEEQ